MFICLTPAIPRGVGQEPQTDIFQNLVRKGNVTWSALDILDFQLHSPGSLFILWKSTQKPIIGCGLNTPHHIISIIGHVALGVIIIHSIEAMNFHFFLHIQPACCKRAEERIQRGVFSWCYQQLF